MTVGDLFDMTGQFGQCEKVVKEQMSFTHLNLRSSVSERSSVPFSPYSITCIVDTTTSFPLICNFLVVKPVKKFLHI